MAKASPLIYSFNAGELSPVAKGRVDLDKYKNGCETLENFIPQVLGPARKRPGTRFVREVKDSSKLVRLIPFEYSTTQAFVLEFGDNYIRFYTEGGVVLNAGVPYEIATYYNDTELAELNFAQSADVIYLTHPNHRVYKLARLAATNWTLTEVLFDSPAFLTENSSSVTITPSTTTGNITLTRSSAGWTSADIGSAYKFSTTPAADYNQWTQGVAHTAGQRVQYQGRVYLAANSATAGSRPPVHTSGTVSDGAVNWTYEHSGSGWATVTGIDTATVAFATVNSMLPTTSATTRWSESAWSAKRGYPRTVTFYDDRLWFGGTSYRPQTLWASVVGDYENFEYGTRDDDALSYTINTQDLNTITWMSPGKVLAVGTSNGEFTVSGNQITDPVTPTSVRITPQTPYGCAGDVRPLRIGSSTLFMQRSNRKMREYTYNFDTDSYVAPNLTRLADHITEVGVVAMAYQQDPDQIVWCPDADGNLLGMTYERDENVVGWHRHTLSGAVESVVTLPHWDGDQDVLWLVVRRTINGATKRYIEYMEKHHTDEYAFFMDSGLTYDGAAATTITGLTHLEGESVAILADGAVHPERTVVSGSITLQYAASVVNVGLPFTATVKTLNVDAGAQDGTAQGKVQRIHNTVIRLHETGPGLWYGPDTTTMDELAFRSSADAMDAPVPLFTGDTDMLAWPGEYEQGVQMTVQHRLPTPCTVVALMPQLVTNDR